jgi:hypothetical protein
MEIIGPGVCSWFAPPHAASQAVTHPNARSADDIRRSNDRLHPPRVDFACPTRIIVFHLHLVRKYAAARSAVNSVTFWRAVRAFATRLRS